MAANFETIGQGAAAHGIDVEALIADINDCIAEVEGNDKKRSKIRHKKRRCEKIITAP